MKRIRVTVTAEDIESGAPGDSETCPIALALTRLGYETAQVGTADWGRSNYESLPLSRGARRFVNSFDSYRDVEPATFLIPVPE